MISSAYILRVKFLAVFWHHLKVLSSLVTVDLKGNLSICFPHIRVLCETDSFLHAYQAGLENKSKKCAFLN